MQWLLDLDTALFHWVNSSLANSFFDGLMPLVSSRTLLPVALLIVVRMAWKMGHRGLPVVLCLAIVLALGEWLIVSPLKDWIDRPRPPLMVPEIRLLMGLGRSASMPSAHAANWFCATMVLGMVYRPSLPWALPLACLVSFSRVYTGVHYPSDVLAGGALGATYGFLGFHIFDRAWRAVGRRWFPDALPHYLLRPHHPVRPPRPSPPPRPTPGKRPPPLPSPLTKPSSFQGPDIPGP